MTNTENAEKIMAEIVELFSGKKLPDTVAKAYIIAPSIPSSSWSLGTRIAMMVADTKDARGYNQWGKVGRNEKRGQGQFTSLVPCS